MSTGNENTPDQRPGVFYLVFILEKPCLFEGNVRPVLANGLEPLCRDGEGNLLANFRDEDGLLLEVDVAAALSCRVELCCTSTVRVPAADERGFACDCTHS